MVSTMRLLEISKRWQRDRAAASEAACPKGHFAAYTREGRRFFVPIAFLGSSVFLELLSMAEEEFGAPAAARPIVLPCNADRLEQILAALRSAGKKCSSSSKTW